MKLSYFFIIPAIYLLFPIYGCSKEADVPGDTPDNPNFVRETAAPLNGLRIAWDRSTRQKISTVPGYNGYPRVKRLHDHSIGAVYESPGCGVFQRSTDGGSTWSSPVKVFTQQTVSNANGSTTVNISNTEFLQLDDGSIIAGCNYRPATDGITPYAIVVSRSTDLGATWSTPQVIYGSQSNFENGCWEPSFLQLPDGTVHCYFANENPYTGSSEQEISLLTSTDRGKTFSADKKMVCFRKKHRDGMPVPVISNDSILVAIEDNGRGNFSPAIVRTAIPDNWSTPVYSSSPYRNYCLTDQNTNCYGGAPYIIKVPSGEIVLSYQTTYNRTSDWELSDMEVAIGDSVGRSFGRLSRPFDVDTTQQCKWNSLGMIDDHTIVASGCSNLDGQDLAAWMIYGHLINDLKIPYKAVTFDGSVTADEYGGYFPFFVGKRNSSNLKAALAVNNGNLYAGIKVNDVLSYVNSSDDSKSDGINVYIDSENFCLTAPDTGIYKIWCSRNGKLIVYEGHQGDWEKVSLPVKTLTKATTKGYDVEIELPLSKMQAKASNTIRVNFGLRNYQSATSGYNESITESNVLSSNTYCKANL